MFLKALNDLYSVNVIVEKKNWNVDSFKEMLINFWHSVWVKRIVIVVKLSPGIANSIDLAMPRSHITENTKMFERYDGNILWEIFLRLRTFDVINWLYLSRAPTKFLTRYSIERIQQRIFHVITIQKVYNGICVLWLSICKTNDK